MNELQIIENELVPVYKTSSGEKVVNGRELHTVLHSGQDFSTWIKKRLSECDAEENKDFTRFHRKMEANNATMVEYIILLDTAKEIAMLERNEKGRQVRKYFIAVEKKYKQGIVDRSQLSPQMQMLYAMMDEQAKVELEQKRQARQIERVEEKQRVLSETFENPSDKEDFKYWCKKCIKKIADTPKFCREHYVNTRYHDAWNESYARLSEKRACRLGQRVRTAREKAEKNGASQSKIKEITYLSIITEDKDLKPVYETVIKEMMLAYCVA